MTKSKVAPVITPYWQKYIKHVAGKAQVGMFSRRDAEQTANLAFLKANKQYNPHKGPFEHYAKAAIRKALITGRTNEQRHSDSRSELTDEMALAEIPAPPWAEEEDRLDDIEAKRAVAHIAMWIQGLPARMATICIALYFEGISQRALADRLGLTQARVSQLNSGLLAQARQDLAFLA